MKLPGFPSFIGKRTNHPEVFLSLLLYPDAVEAAIWELSAHGKPNVLGAVTQDIVHDSWQERRAAADKCITTLEDIAQTTNLQKVILGFPAPYLTKDGDIIKDIRPSVKKLTHELGLVPIGFVSVYQAIIHKYKKQEGVPPSLILLGFTAGSISVSLYRVGNFAGQITIPKEGSIAEHLEDAFAQFSSSTVLPSRILLYGTKPAILEQAKRELLKHHWTARSNFIHFPKVEVLQGDGAAIAVSYAGAGELTNTIDDQDVVEETVPEEEGVIDLPQEEMLVEEESVRVDDAEEVEEQVEAEMEQEELIEDELAEEESRESDEDSEIIEEGASENAEDIEEHANVIPVDPQTLGFQSGEEEMEEESEPKTSRHGRKMKLQLPALFGNLKKKFFKGKSSAKHHQTEDDVPESQKRPLGFALLIIPLIILLVAGYYVIDTFLPKAKVTITTIPKSISASETINVDTSSTSISGNTIPGKKKEQSATGEKSVPATGKKTIGDGAKGKITILNKSTVPKTFKRGTIVSTGGIDFTLDSDISIASASETFQGITYSKEDVAVSAKQIGTKGNISAGHDFSINGVSSTVASGRNDQAFTGGTSKDVTVVARADQEEIIKELTTELTAQAKQGFESTGEELLIPETIKTSVTEKVFSAEIGQEAKDVNGKVTITITGTGYSTSDITSLLKDKVKSQVSSGYMLSSDIPKVETGTPTVQKNGTISLSATITATSIPDLNLPTLANQIAGKSSAEAKQSITALPGIGNVEFSISSMFHKDRLPKRLQNITLLVSNGQ